MNLRLLLAAIALASLAGAAPCQRPDLKYRWVYVMTNLQVKENVPKLVALMERAKAVGYNGVVIADSKMDRLSQVPTWYFDNTKQLLAEAKRIGMDVYPAIFPI